MTNTKMTPQNVTFKNLKVGFGHDCGGVSGTMYFGKTKVAEFYADGWSGSIDDIEFFDKKLEQEAIDYQKEKETESFFQTTEMFINSALMNAHMLDGIKSDVKKEIAKFKKEYNVSNKETIGAYIFLTADAYSYSVFNGIPTELTTEKLNSYLEKAKEHKKYESAEEAYFMKFLSPRKVMFEKIK